MIQLEGVEKVYRTERIETVALTSINLSVREGEFISIMGPSGSGKSTLLNLIGLLDVPSDGKVAINEKPITSYSDRNLARGRTKLLDRGADLRDRAGLFGRTAGLLVRGR